MAQRLERLTRTSPVHIDIHVYRYLHVISNMQQNKNETLPTLSSQFRNKSTSGAQRILGTGDNEVLICLGPTRFLDYRGQRGFWMPGAKEVLVCPGPKRFLDSRGQRGSWIPGANEVIGCPGPTRFLDAGVGKIHKFIFS